MAHENVFYITLAAIKDENIVMNLCKTLSDLSLEIFNWMSAQPAVKEESLTDWLLYELSKREKKVFYKAFTRHEESWYTGADWDWVFVFNDGIVRLRVQAKRLRANKNNQPDILRQKNGIRQIALLISSAIRKKSYPVYTFFTDDTSKSLCARGVIGNNGAYLGGAFSVLENLTTKSAIVAPKDALAISYPLPCIVCCPIAADSGSARSLIAQIHRYFGSPIGEQENSQDLGYQENIPDFVKELLQSDGKISDAWEEKYAKEFEETSALLVFDARG